MLFTIMLFFFSFIFFMCSVYLHYLNGGYIIEWDLVSEQTFNIVILFLFDWISFIFVSLVFFVASMIYFYSISYFKNDMNKYRFFIVLFMFIMSMMILIIMPNMISMLAGWDGLGLTSYCLVVYYGSSKAYNSGMITFLLNRIGDVLLLLLIAFVMMFGTWNVFLWEGNFLLSMILMLAAITKSAQIPFSSWLPKAMAAPTPVSALVHSSTLVTAGVYLLIRYDMFINKSILMILLFISSMTMFMAGLMANIEYDLKKIIALSTLSQLGLMLSIYSLGFSELAFFHLYIHAMFKSLLFMCGGAIIHMMMNNQDIRYMGGLIKIYPYLSGSMLVASLSLCGFPFVSGFFSKDLILEVMLMSKMNFISFLMLIFGTIFTVSYSVRLFMLMMLMDLNVVMVCKKEDTLMSGAMFMLVLLSLMWGKFISVLLFDNYIIILSIMSKGFIIFMMIMGVILGVSLVNLKFKKDLGDFISSMFYLDYIYNELSYFIILGNYFYLNSDKNLIENFTVWGVSKSMWYIFKLFPIIKFDLYECMFISCVGIILFMFFW